MDSPESDAHRDVNEDGDDKQSNSKEKNENKPPLFADGWISVRYGISPRWNETEEAPASFYMKRQISFAFFRTYGDLFRSIEVLLCSHTWMWITWTCIGFFFLVSGIPLPLDSCLKTLSLGRSSPRFAHCFHRCRALSQS